MSSDSFNANETSFSFNWPFTLSGIERVALSAKGDLQRTLSAYFSQPISVARGYTSPDPTAPVSSASHTTPLEQVRSVDLICRDRVVCMCTSTVTMTSPTAAQLVLVDKYPIGQVFRALGTAPAFQLLDVGLTESGKGLWRVYTLKTDQFQCRIREEFPDRAMFYCDNWLDLPTHSVANHLPTVVDSGKSVVAH
ncbi:hypothetical protein RSOL_277260 [Rhizoctonia solani AG-3 Rhs1AP]|uniref:Uncharacterized protein n=1 Tax=Rhizoctonia solani AG-3 Rhs1AP TaxID=1086054 RepID=A0A0A1UK57_9AGAM|nr:hypothetical protein RSOL_277260 [Rhizoctonia solani AG-3 Rhs1AP]